MSKLTQKLIGLLITNVVCVGFIDFIVDPSFQVMGDMLDKILAPLQQQRRKQRAEDIYRELSKATSRSSLSSTDQSPEGHDDEDDDVSNHSNDDSLSSDSRSKAGGKHIYIYIYIYIHIYNIY